MEKNNQCMHYDKRNKAGHGVPGTRCQTPHAWFQHRMDQSGLYYCDEHKTEASCGLIYLTPSHPVTLARHEYDELIRRAGGPEPWSVTRHIGEEQHAE